MIIFLKGIGMGRLIIDGKAVYELDEECLKQRKTEYRNQDKQQKKNRPSGSKPEN